MKLGIKEVKMKYAIVFTKDEKAQGNDGAYQIFTPDLPGCSTHENSIDLGLDSIQQSIKSHLAILAEYGEKIPNARSIEVLRKEFELENPHTFSQAFWTFIDIDITPYLGKSHKINVTLPELLIKQIDDKVSKSTDYKTRSGFIANACMAELQK
jgi:predicted RNase H-like HicB family nuclease